MGDLREVAQTSQGNTLFVETNKVGGHRYWSDEVGSGVMLWDTSLTSPEMLRLALQQEEKRMEGTQTPASTGGEQRPSVGRVVHYYTTNSDQQRNGQGAGPYAAIVTAVWSPGCVDLEVFAYDDAGRKNQPTSVGLKTPQQTGGSWWEWPPRV